MKYSATFNRLPTKTASFWQVTDESGKEVIKASVAQLWGKQAFKMYDKVATEDYGNAILARIEKDGLEKVAATMGVEPMIGGDAPKAKPKFNFNKPKSDVPAVDNSAKIPKELPKAEAPKADAEKKPEAPKKKSVKDYAKELEAFVTDIEIDEKKNEYQFKTEDGGEVVVKVEAKKADKKEDAPKSEDAPKAEKKEEKEASLVTAEADKKEDKGFKIEITKEGKKGMCKQTSEILTKFMTDHEKDMEKLVKEIEGEDEKPETKKEEKKEDKTEKKEPKEKDEKETPKEEKMEHKKSASASHSKAFDVFLDGKNIDTVFYSIDEVVDADEVKKSLIEHDGYDPNIEVEEVISNKKASLEVEEDIPEKHANQLNTMSFKKKTVNEKDFYSKAYGDKGFANGLTKNYSGKDGRAFPKIAAKNKVDYPFVVNPKASKPEGAKEYFGKEYGDEQYGKKLTKKYNPGKRAYPAALITKMMQKQASLKKEALELWKSAPNYGGEDYSDYYVVAVRTRDSNAVEESNFESALKKLGGEKDGVMVARANHWAVGWVEYLLVHKGAAEKVAIAQDIEAKLAEYPILDEDDMSQREIQIADQAYEDYIKDEAIEHLGLNADELSPEDFEALKDAVMQGMEYGEEPTVASWNIVEEAWNNYKVQQETGSKHTPDLPGVEARKNKFREMKAKRIASMEKKAEQKKVAYDFTANQDIAVGDKVEGGTVVEVKRVQDVYANEEEFNQWQETYGQEGLSWEGNEIVTVDIDKEGIVVEKFIYEIEKDEPVETEKQIPMATETKVEDKPAAMAAAKEKLLLAEKDKQIKYLEKKVANTELKVEKLANDRNELIDEKVIRIKAEKSLDLYKFALSKGLVEETEKDEFIEQTMDMDDKSFALFDANIKKMASKVVTASNTSTEVTNKNGSRIIVKNAGMKKIPNLASEKVELGDFKSADLKDKIASIWTVTKRPQE